MREVFLSVTKPKLKLLFNLYTKTQRQRQRQRQDYHVQWVASVILKTGAVAPAVRLKASGNDLALKLKMASSLEDVANLFVTKTTNLKRCMELRSAGTVILRRGRVFVVLKVDL